MSYHYDEEVIRARRGSQIKTIQAMTELLENYENEDYYRPVSYTHLDVYKRQFLQFMSNIVFISIAENQELNGNIGIGHSDAALLGKHSYS